MRPDVRSKQVRPMYGIGASFVIFRRDGSRHDLAAVARLRAYHQNVIDDACASDERVRNNRAWLAELEAAVAGSWPQTQAAAE